MRRIVIEVHDNDDYISIHTNFVLSTVRLFSSDKDEDTYGNKASAEVLQLRSAVSELAGVTDTISLEKYELNVKKSPAFEWSEIVPQVVAHIVAFDNTQLAAGGATMEELGKIEEQITAKDSRSRRFYDADGYDAGKRELPPLPTFGVPIFVAVNPATPNAPFTEAEGTDNTNTN